MKEFTFHGSDGTKLIGWTNEGSGPRVLLCNGLAAPAQSWPGLLDPTSGFEVVSWHQRGFFGSDRPGRIDDARLEVQSGDAVALMDHLGWDEALFLGWSFGVNMAVEVAHRHPQRMTGLVAVAGVPGGTFGSLLGRNPLPGELRRAIGLTGTAFGETQAWGINQIAHLIPSSRVLAQLLISSRFISSHAETSHVAAMVGSYFDHDFGWYFATARLLAEHEPQDVSDIDVPAEVLVGARDQVTDPRAVERFGHGLPDGQVLILGGTHFLPVEFPEEIVAALRRVDARSGPAEDETGTEAA